MGDRERREKRSMRGRPDPSSMRGRPDPSSMRGRPDSSSMRGRPRPSQKNHGKARGPNNNNNTSKKKNTPEKQLFEALDINISLKDYIETENNLNINELIDKLIKNNTNILEKDLDSILKNYNYDIEEYSYLSFYDICLLLNIYHKKDNDVNDNIKKIIKNIIEDNFKNIIKHVHENYFLNLMFDYVDNDNKIIINTKNIMKNTMQNFETNLNVLKEILIKIIEDNKFIDIDKKNFDFIKNHIEDPYKKKIKNKFIYSYPKSILYNYNDDNDYNIDKKYRDLKYQDKSIDNDKLTDDIDKNLIFYDTNSKKIYKRNKNFDFTNKRIILSKKQLSKYHKEYNTDFKEKIVNLKNILIELKEKQEDLLKNIDFINKSDNKIDFNIINNEIKNKIKKILGMNKNIHYDTDIFYESKKHFKKELDKLNDEILNILLQKNNILDDKIFKYNNFINKYSLWINNIIIIMNNYPNKSIQYNILNSITHNYITDDDILRWVNNSKITNINYWLPIKTNISNAKHFFINIINNKVSWEIDNDDLLIYNSNNLNETIYCWNNNIINISLPKLDNENELIKIVIKGYYKANMKIGLNDFPLLKPLVKKCIKNKDKNKFEDSCKNFITIFDIIKDIVKSKYRFDLNKNSLENIQNDISKYKNNLLDLLPK